MSSFGDTISKLQSRLANNSSYSAWIKFIAGSLILNTSTDTNLFVSLENKKTGTGMANCFTLNIAYVPYATYTVDRFGDVNYIDKCFVSNTTWECTLQYGYDYGPDGLITPEYKGMITGYTKEIQGSMILYTITGYSGIVKLTEEKIDHNTIVGSNGGKIRATEAAKLVLEEYTTGYTVVIDSNALNKDEEQESISGTSGKELFSYIDTILKSAIDTVTTQNSSVITGYADQVLQESKASSNPVYYTYIIDDVKKEIRIVRIDKSSSTLEQSLIFNWMDKTNSVVIDFKPKYEGVVLMVIGNSAKKSISLDEGAATISESTVKDNVNVGAVASSDAQIEISTWAEAVRTLPMTATMITVGIPYDVQILTKIGIVPIIYGQKDLSSGEYMITGVTDNIDSGGFISTFELMKVI